MDERKLYEQRSRARLDEWNAELDKLKARAAKADADVRLKLKQQAEELEGRISDYEAKLSELSKAGDEAWESVRDGIDSAWKSLETSFAEAASKFKDRS